MRVCGLFQLASFHSDKGKKTCTFFHFPEAVWFLFVSCCYFALNSCGAVVLKVWLPAAEVASPGNLLEM